VLRNAFLVVSLALATTGCSLLQKPPAGTGQPRSVASDAQVISDYLTLLETLAKAAPAQQAELAESAHRAASVDATTVARLRWALIQASPGHGRSDPTAARTLLGELLAAPERLLPGERALAGLVLRDLNARLALSSESESQRQSAGGALAERDRAVAQARRLQADNDRLKKELDDAKAKLAAIAELERSLSDRAKQ